MEAGDSSDLATAVGCPSETELAGRASVCEGCPGRELCQSQGGRDPDQEAINIRMGAIKRKVLVLSGKGGVGKSSIAANLSMALARSGRKVGLADLDICGPSMPRMMGVEGQNVTSSEYGWMPCKSPHGDVKVLSVGTLLADQDSAVIWRGPRKTSLIKRFLKDVLWGRLDFLVFDTPPGTSDEHLTVVKALKDARPDGAVIVATPQDAALVTVRKEITFCRRMDVPILGVVENMAGFVCPCCKEVYDIFSAGGGEKLAAELGLRFLGRIPLDPTLSVCCESGECVFDKAPTSPASDALAKFAEAVVAAIEQ